MALATVLFSSMAICVRLAGRSVPWTEIAAFRAGVGALVAFSAARLLGSSLRVVRPGPVWGRTLLGTAAKACTFFALSAPAIALGDVATLRGTGPLLIIVLGALLLGERAGRRMWFALPLALVGVVVVVQPQFAVSGHLASLVLLGAVFSAGAMVLIRHVGAHETPEAIAFHFSAVAAVIMTAASIPYWIWPQGWGLVWLVAAGLFGGVAQLALTRAYTLEVAGRIGVFGYSGIVVTQVLAAVFLGERLQPNQVLGSALVVGSGVLLTGAALRDRRRRAALV